MSKNSSKQTSQRIYLDWTQPALASVVHLLVQRFRHDHKLDLSGLILVTPGLRSRQRLLELLVDAAEEAQLIFTPPELLPVAGLPERLLPGRGPFANAVQETIAWVRAIEHADRRWLPPAVNDQLGIGGLGDWLPWAQLLRRLHAEIASDGWLFGDLRRALVDRQSLLDPGELARWQALAEVQQAYFAQLATLGALDRHQACIAAVSEQSCELDRDLYLIGTVDLNHGLRAMLAQVAPRVFPVIFADPAQHDFFDALGSLVVDRWLETPIDLPDTAIRFVDRPIDQATAVVEILAELDPPIAANQVTIGVPDLRIVPHLERRLACDGIASRRLAGKSFHATSLGRLLEATCRYLETWGFAEFAAWVRHPDLFEYLSRAAGDASFLGSLDRFQNDVIPQDFDVRGSEALHLRKGLASVVRHARELLLPLCTPPRPLPQWVTPWREFLAAIYADQPLEPNNPGAQELTSAAATLQAHLATLAAVADDGHSPVSAVEALRMVLELAGDESIPSAPNPGAIELAGWLDLPLDDAVVTIVTSFNDDSIPSAVNSDAFLTNSLRQALGLMDNSQRYARDAYALALLARSPRNLWLVACRHDTAHDPLVPSRLLFACDDDTLVRRAQAYFDFAGPDPQGLWLARGRALPRQQHWPIPLPRAEWARVEKLRVTDFKQFLQCPYRFFLGRVLGLQAVADDWREMPPYVFGLMMHDVLEAFARDAAAEADDPQVIRAFLDRELEHQLVRRYGPNPAAAVRIQSEQIRMRLEVFADRQAEWRRQGWKIIDAEVENLETWLEVDGEPFRVYGRIDRIDRNERDGSFAIFDYKTADRPTPPDDSHRKDDSWIDLQLPLYRHLAQHKYSELKFPCQLGYVLLPRTLSQVAFAVAPWTAADLEAADEAARAVIRSIRRAEFWPPTDPPPYPDTEWIRICQEHVAERWNPPANSRPTIS